MYYKRILLLFTVLLVTIVAAAQSNLDSILNDFHNRADRILVAAHRAEHPDFPENSVAAMKEAIRLGVDIIETDIRETKDGVMIIMHDKTVDRTTTGKGPVAGMTYAELQQLFLLHDGKPTTEKIPTFKEVLELVKGKVMLDIDYKAEGKRAARSAARLLRKTGTEKQALFFLYDYKDAPALRRMNKKIQFMTRAYSKEDVDGIFNQGIAVPVIHADDKFYSDSLMGVIRGKGIRLWMNALGKYDKMERTEKDSGFDALLQMRHTNIIQTDLYAELMDYLKLRGLHR
ncbi:glycerophosphodiester phosphodiesterase family protein [Agriterribacter sp.]|uniref:glycerophosphodiester phosphodiesterase family protein n=1 Tax=Agriterribacter sp. TaxID=2821509 RepID=UPI002BDD2BEA|nr:glycerophosphodiester phosphodiesterase family protein [Agriterribacter sp.]HRO45171.1 glycerophosphodiester phosphodiesterase family protein [Agriterribacter sp.]HRQ17776.1 glycerophosphodiester phosphodiesterase family protein [Agriterribacter sp.]